MKSIALVFVLVAGSVHAWPCDTHDYQVYRDEARKGAPHLMAAQYCTMEKVRTEFVQGKGTWTEDEAKRCTVEKEKIYDAVRTGPSSSFSVQALERMNTCSATAPPRSAPLVAPPPK